MRKLAQQELAQKVIRLLADEAFLLDALALSQSQIQESITLTPSYRTPEWDAKELWRKK